MATSGEAPQLEYASRSPRFGQRVYRWAIVAAVFVAVFFCRTWPLQWWEHFRLLYLQSRCLAHPVSGGTIVYSSGVPEVVITSPQRAAFAAADRSVRFSPTTSPIATVFLGQLQASNGFRALVEVEAHVHWKPKGFSDVMVYSRTVQFSVTKTLLDISQTDGGPTANADPRWSHSIPDIAICSAKIDPNDLSHISFECRLFQEDYVVDGYLQNDGRFVCTKWTDLRLPLQSTRPSH